MTSKQIPNPARLLGLGLSLIALGPLSSSAQQSDDQNAPKPGTDQVTTLNPYVIDETRVVDWNSQMTFSGGHTAGDLLEIPTNITILTSDFLSDIGALNLLGALEYGGSGVMNNVDYREDLTVRGFRQTPLRDGTAYPNLGFTLMYDIDKIEVIKGPDALMFNSYGNISGGVNYVTKRPTSEPAGEAYFTIGNFGTYIGSITSSGPLNRSGSLRYRATVGMQLDSGWQGQGTDANNYSNNQGYSLGVDWDVNPKLLFRFDIGEDLDRMRQFGSGLTDPVTGTLWKGSADGFSISTDWSWFDTNTNRGTIEGILKATPELTLRWKTTGYDSAWNYDFPTAQGVPGANNTLQVLNPSEYPNYTEVIGLYAEKFIYNITDINTYLDAAYIKDFGPIKLQLTGGYNYLQSNNNYDLYDTAMANEIIGAPILSRESYIPYQDLVPNGSGPQVQGSYEVSRNGGWTAYTQETLSAFNGRLIMVGGVLYVSPGTNTQSQSTVVPNEGIIYRILPTISLYGSTGKSFTPEAGFDSFGNPLKNEPGNSAEGGIKLNALNGHLFGIVDYFNISEDNVLTQTTGKSLTTGKLVFGDAQVGRETNKGFEADLGWVQHMGEGDFSVYLTGYLANPIGAQLINEETGYQPHNAQKEKATIFAKYTFTSGVARGFGLGGGSNHEGGSPGDGFVWQPAYTVYSGLLFYTTGHWKFAINVDNLADTRGIIMGSEGVGYVYLYPPLTFKSTITYKW